jgi:hypothetical protein
MERVPGIEPGYSAWKAAALPLSYTRIATVDTATAASMEALPAVGYGHKNTFKREDGGGSRTRTYEGVASGFTVRPLCRSGHSPITTARQDGNTRPVKSVRNPKATVRRVMVGTLRHVNGKDGISPATFPNRANRLEHIRFTLAKPVWPDKNMLCSVWITACFCQPILACFLRKTGSHFCAAGSKDRT